MQHTFYIDDSTSNGMRLVTFLKKLSSSKNAINVIEEIEDMGFLDAMKQSANSGRVDATEIELLLDKIINE